MECQGFYVFEMEEKHEVGIDQVDHAPTDWTILAYESREMEKMRNYFMSMPDRSAEQTLCIMPQIDIRPTSREKI